MQARYVLRIGAVFALAAGTSAATASATPAQHPPNYVKQATATGTGGAVASAEFNASKAGIETLRSGGNAIDAAVAVASTLGVTEPFVAGAGGGGYMVIYLAKTKQMVTIDGREMCAAACNPNLFLDPATGKPLAFEDARRSGLSVGVPGMVATWDKAVKAYGRKSLGSNLNPAIEVADQGFTVTPNFVDQEKEALADLQTFTSSRKLFLTKDGQPLPAGSTLRNPDLAHTYSEIAKHGASYLYGGPLGNDIARAVTHPPVWSGSTFNVRPGLMTAQDVANYVAKTRQPTHVNYRGLDVYGMPPSSSGGTTTGEALNILNGWNLSGESRAQATFHYLEASRLAFADRNAYVGDSDYQPVPVQGLLDPAFAATRRCLVGNKALTSPVAPGIPFAPYGTCPTSKTAANPVHEGTQTNHLVVADKWGNVVSYTNTIEQVAGSGITVPGRGFLLNNEMTDFDFAPATPSTYDPNLPAPGKRPRSSMSPTIVLKAGAPDFTLGSPGGATIITTVLQTLINHVDFGMSLPQALAAPRVSQRNNAKADAEPAFLSTDLAKVLTSQYGEQFAAKTGPVLPADSFIGNATGIDFLPGGRFQAAAEPVRSGGGSALVVNPQ
ncbi:MAG: gamma-glutamyltranspeptidase / glutathione hydrolase [Pseudonocardiales bacterium]|nr:gamma-glutamyltranspeptidase / glutathione hydrolase [Pseudonocardiales bacterium]